MQFSAETAEPQNAAAFDLIFSVALAMLACMSGTFTKSILKVGTYHSPDGTVVVTPERLRHWERETRRLQSAKYAIPSHFDHASDLDMLEPIAMDVLARKQNRSAAATVGHLDSFKVAPDGKSAEIVLTTLTPTAQEKVASNAVYVSPVIFPEWKDGAGNKYRDVITSVDLVDHPVDYSQSSFIPAIRMGLCSTPYLLSGIRMARKPKKQRSVAARKARLVNAIRMGTVPDDDDDEKKDYGNDAADTGGDAEPAPADDMGATADDAPADDGMSPADIGIDESEAFDALDQVLNLLAEFGVTLPDDTDDSTIIRHLRVALTALLNSDKPEDDLEDDTVDDMTGELPATAPGGMPQASAPNIATMSVQQRATLTYAENLHKKTVDDKLDALLETGRCTPAECDKCKRQLQAVKLSLTADGTPKPSDVEKFIASRSAIPAGTMWTNEQRTRAATKLSVVDAPTQWTGGGGPSRNEFAEAVAALGGKA